MFARHLPRRTRITTNHIHLRYLYNAEGLGTSSTYKGPRPRVVFSGIQPTGIPHVSFLPTHLLTDLQCSKVRELPRCIIELGQNPAISRTRRPDNILDSRMARTDSTAGPKGP